MKKTYTEKTRIRFWASILALIWISLATKMGVEATIALINHSEMYNWKNGTMSPQSGYVYMGIFIIFATLPIYMAIKPRVIQNHLKTKSNKSSDPT